MELPQKTIKIGVAISTRNRRDIFNECYRNWKKCYLTGLHWWWLMMPAMYRVDRPTPVSKLNREYLKQRMSAYDY